MLSLFPTNNFSVLVRCLQKCDWTYVITDTKSMANIFWKRILCQIVNAFR